ncbi:exodeoxyribonuclease III [Candidatus Gracilibacteria bacterium]|nr:exodeoxyribonuclease III [Candidatus Gracilibacteria bacterium]
MKIISWNVNGIRAAEKKGFLKWLQKEKPDILGLQEIKAMQEQLSQDLLAPHDYHTFFNSAEKKGYSGTALYSRTQPKSITTGLPDEQFNSEGRLISADYGDFTFFNIYFPNGKAREERLKYKLGFYESALKHFDDLVSQGKNLIITGDYNTAHKEIDLARPKANTKISGFLPIERQWLDKLTEHGYVDCFREFNKDPENYTWWSMRAGSRQRNVGWRIDYFFVSKNFRKKIKNCYHLTEVMGSDHCPIVLEI